MLRHDVEARALHALDLIEAGRKVEDDLEFEFKRSWPDPMKVARRLAAHANTARGRPIIWLIGVDEDEGVVEFEDTEFSTWWAQVGSMFDGSPPDLGDHFATARDGKSFKVLQFDTHGSPYVVRSEKREDKRLEVPWREGTAARSARHEDLIRLLAPRISRPRIELRDGRLEFASTKRDGEDQWFVDLRLGLFVESPLGEYLVVPNHRCWGGFGRSDDLSRVEHLPSSHLGGRMTVASGGGPNWGARRLPIPVPASPVDTVHTADGAIVISGPGNMTAYASGRLDAMKWEPRDLPDELIAFYSFMPIAFEEPIGFRAVLRRTAEEDPTKAISWALADDEIGRFAVD